MTGCTGAKFPIIACLCRAPALIRKILMSGAKSEECSVRELLKYQVPIEKTFLMFQES